MSSALSRLENWERPSARDRYESRNTSSVEAPVENTRSEKPSARLLRQISEAGYEMDELTPFLKTRGDLLAVACAGAGKTSGLIFKILYDGVRGELSHPIEVNGQVLRAPHRVWVSTFLRTGALELRRAMAKWQHTFKLFDIARSVTFSTMHAEFKAVLESVGVDVNIIDDRENKKLLSSILKSYNIYLNSEEMNQFTGGLTYTRNRLDKSRFDVDIYVEKGIAPAVIDSIIVEWGAARRREKKMDFEDLQDLLYDWLYLNPDERIVDAAMGRYKYIYVDEFQDTSQKQYAILKKYSEGANKTVVIGDDDQTIYTWRGSSIDIITRDFERDYKPTVVKLSKNYRCPSNILNPIIPSIEMNENRYEKPIRASREGGTQRIGYFNGYSSMTNALVKGIARDIAEGRNVAVLCRTNIDGLVPALMLDKAGLSTEYSISGANMTLDSYIGRKVIDLLYLVNARGGEHIKNALGQLIYDRVEPKIIADECRSSKMRLWDLDLDEIVASTPKLAVHLIRWLEAWHVKELRGFDMLNYLLGYYLEHAYARDTQYNQMARGVIEAVMVLSTSGEYDNISELIEDITDMNDRLKARMKNTAGVDISIATVHEYKGKEADSVYIWNDSYNVFPHVKAGDLEEERRLHYIACTRARQMSTILTLEDKVGQFVREMDLSNAEVAKTSIQRRI